MFGSIKPCKKYLTEDQRKQYRKYYCGLCFAMDRNFGKYARFFVNFDLTNDFLLSGSMTEDKTEHQAVCPWSWRRKTVTYIDSPSLSDYFAKLNYLLVYCNLLDDVEDDKSFLARKITERMTQKAQQVTEEMPQETRLLGQYLEKLKKIEKENRHLPVFPTAQLFGMLLRTMVNPPQMSDADLDIFAEINYWVGIWIYTADAVADCMSDSRKKRYNPILAGIDADAATVLRVRKKEILDIFKQCRTNLLMLLEMCPVYENKELLIRLFSQDLPKIIRMYLEVEKNELAD